MNPQPMNCPLHPAGHICNAGTTSGGGSPKPYNGADEIERPYDRPSVPPPHGGVKFDNDKIRMDLISPHAMQAMAHVLTIGAKKYGDRNWERGMSWSRCFAAALRHLWAWWALSPHDGETGLSHLAHAMCCLMFLLHYEIVQVGVDDRPQPQRYPISGPHQ